MGSAYYVNPRGISEGITLWWRDDVCVTVKAATQKIIDCELKTSDHPNLRLMTWVYADADTQRREQN